MIEGYYIVSVYSKVVWPLVKGRDTMILMRLPIEQAMRKEELFRTIEKESEILGKKYRRDLEVRIRALLDEFDAITGPEEWYTTRAGMYKAGQALVNAPKNAKLVG